MRIKPVFKYKGSSNKEIDKATLKQCKCLLTISVGQEVHEGDKFAATIDLVNAWFGSAILLIDDSLQRHSMALDKLQDADYFYAFSLLQGDLWLERNKPQYQRLTILQDILRWDQWLHHPHYAEQQQKIKACLAQQPDYQASFNHTIEEFLRRYDTRLPGSGYVDKQRAKALCLDYLIEECSALCLWPELGCHFEVYPSPRNLAMEQTHQRFVLPDYPDLLHPLAIKFKNRKQLKPQQFHPLATTKEN